MGAFRQAGGLDPMLAGTLGGLLTTWVTFTPCFLWIFLGAPYAEALRANRALSAALAAITAAVVGVIFNLAIWFALHSLFGATRRLDAGPLHFDLPNLATANVPAMLLTLAAIVAIFRLKLGPMPVLALSAAAGVAYWLLLGANR
jgi:chromate transporter